MSVEKVPRKNGFVWRVRWRDDQRNERSRVLGSRRDADLFDADITRRKRMGELARMDAGKQLVTELAAQWWSAYAEPNLDVYTREINATIFDKHLLRRIGGMAIRDVTFPVVARMSADMQAQGAGPAVTRKAMSIGQSIFGYAQSCGYVQVNPFVGVKKPSGKRKRAVKVLMPESVEIMRRHLIARGQHRDAVMIAVLAYAGLRPGEAMALAWPKVRERTLLVDQAASDGRLKRTKNKETRAVRLPAPLAVDLAEWRIANGRPDDGFVFPNASGTAWRRHDWKNWTNRVFLPTARATGVRITRPYDLRHSFCSLLIYEGRLSIAEIAEQMGHSMAMTQDTYGHVMDEARGAEKVPAEDAIRATRAADVSGKCPPLDQAATG
jgi:integrase